MRFVAVLLLLLEGGSFLSRGKARVLGGS